MTGEEILAIKMRPKQNEAGAKSIRDYLQKLLLELWYDGEGFSGKRPFGNSGWDHDLYKALIEAKAIEGVLDEDGYIESHDHDAGNKLIVKAIKAL